MAVEEATGVLDADPTAEATPEKMPDQAAVAETSAPVARNRSAESPADLAADLAGNVADPKNLEMLLDVNLKVTVELGRTHLKFRDVLNLSAGSIVELARQASEPVDILVNGAVLAQGEVVVVDDNFAVRITKLLSRGDQLKKVV